MQMVTQKRDVGAERCVSKIDNDVSNWLAGRVGKHCGGGKGGMKQAVAPQIL
jgi:hypothetical protein